MRFSIFLRVLTPIFCSFTLLTEAVVLDYQKVYVANQYSNDVSVINTAADTVTKTVAVEDFPIALAVTPNGRKAYIANNFSGTVSVINTATDMVIKTVGVGSLPI
ncbi:hypothetical protein COB11_06190, partial [Candidatus Aerophobetes bacterium]